MNGIGSALQGMQHNLQQLANNLPKPPGRQHPQQQQSMPGTSVSRLGSDTAQQQGVSHGHQASQQWASPSSSTLPTAATPTFPAAAAAAAAAAGGRSSRAIKQQQQQQQAVTKEELGRATWVFLHTLAAQFPAHPSRQQQRDARQFMDCFTRIYPCADCAQHFQEIVK
jgi:FAD-linked sulfhydryl oxidase